MRKIPLSFGLVYYLEELDATEAALSADADPDANALAAPFLEAITEWDDIFKKQRLARRAVIRAEAVVAVKNVRLDMTTLRFSKLVAAVAAALLPKVFKTTPGRFVRWNLRKQSEDTQNVIVPEIQKLDPKHTLKPFEGELKTGADEALAALDARSQAKGARQTAMNDVDEYKEGVNALRTTTFAELLKIATEKGYPRTWVESFFRSDSSSTEEETTETPEATEPTEGKKGDPA